MSTKKAPAETRARLSMTSKLLQRKDTISFVFYTLTDLQQ